MRCPDCFVCALLSQLSIGEQPDFVGVVNAAVASAGRGALAGPGNYQPQGQAKAGGASMAGTCTPLCQNAGRGPGRGQPAAERDWAGVMEGRW